MKKPAAKATPATAAKAPVRKPAAPAAAKVQDAPKPAKAAAAPAPVVAAAPAPAPGIPPRARASARLTQLTVPSMPQAVASTAAKSSAAILSRSAWGRPRS